MYIFFLRIWSPNRSTNAPPRGQETIYCYCIETGELTRRRVREVYAVKDLYKDIKTLLDVDGYGIEKQLSVLENQACRSVRQILDLVERHSKGRDKRKRAPGPVSYGLRREHLNNLRKFMFVMHYHQLSIAETYFQEDHPENTKIRSWIQAFRERNNLAPSDVWLHVLRYYLDTPHSEIIKHGTEAEISMTKDALRARGLGTLSKILPSKFSILQDLSKREVNPDLEHWESVAYSTQMAGFFLNIWEAAPGEEFIISSNSFGLYEGRKDPYGPLHRFYVVSPKIILVLCHVGFKPKHSHSRSESTLSPGHAELSMVPGAPHKAENMSDGDWFDLEISTLTTAQTHAINAIVLAHVNDKGMITFHSKEAVLRTLAAFDRNPWFRDCNQIKYAHLFRDLRGNYREPSGECPTSIMSLYLGPWSPAPGSLWEVHFEIYNMLHEGNDHDCRNYKEYENVVILAAEKIFSRYAEFLGLGTRKSEDLDLRPVRLARKMDDALAEKLFYNIETLLMQAGVNIIEAPMFAEQVMIAVLGQLLENNRGFFDELEQRLGNDIKEYIDVRHPPKCCSASVDVMLSTSVVGGSVYMYKHQTKRQTGESPTNKA